MASVEIKLKDSVTGKLLPVELPDDAPMSDLLPILAEKLGLEDTGRHRLRNVTKGIEYNENDTLSTHGTEAGDKCELSYEPEFGVA